ncbi:Uncharacterized protein TCAP_04853 [Tolypocladium capitatum]|uniref:Uncharacterized protein n=1 Tax=Tolypocladium capitatum TaxID=45235 RepID=A0A2K3QCD9_9HYPO|nr:Uncharacterized protein TCAP_04853 [Tolypocladium capitatum]
MATSGAVRFVMGGWKSPAPGSLRLQLRVKPGTGKDREGVSSVSDDYVHLCVAAQARGGEANRAVVQLLSDAIGLPKTRFHLSHGFKSRDKTVVLAGVAEAAYAETVLDLLRKASG